MDTPSRFRLLRLAFPALLLAAASCAEGGEPSFEEEYDASVSPSNPNDSSTFPPATYDAFVPSTLGGLDASDYTPADSGASDSSSSPIDSGSSSSSDSSTGDGGGFLAGLGGLIGGGSPGTDAGKPLDPGSQPAPGGGPDNPAGWKLDQGSAKECPEVPPPIPVLGGLCVGIYWTCNWTNAAGQKYFCTCDWIHYLCI